MPKSSGVEFFAKVDKISAFNGNPRHKSKWDDIFLTLIYLR
jgi:hypothetical protein